MSNARKSLSLSLVLALVCSGCASTQQGGGMSSLETPGMEACRYDKGKSAIVGAILGGLLGAAIAGPRNRGTGVVIGALAGGLAGDGAAAYLQRRCEALGVAKTQMHATELAYGTISLSPAGGEQTAGKADEDSGVIVSANSPAMFDRGGAELTPSGAGDMTALASAFADTDRRLLIVGHTDSTGSPEFNQRLSEQRAKTVAHLFERFGIHTDHIYYKGAGDTEPLDSNQTEQGRARNRRVEVVELSSEDQILAYSHAAQSSTAFLQRRFEDSKSTRVAQAQPSAPTAANPKMPTSKKRSAESIPITPAGTIPALKPGTRFEFGGSVVSATGVSLASYVGQRQAPERSAILNLLAPTALADSPQDVAFLRTACIADREIEEVDVKLLATGRPVSRRIGNYMSGLYGSSWTKTLNGNLVGITNVSVLKDGGRVDTPPTVHVFSHYKPGEQKPSLSSTGVARAFVGDKGVLYRMYLKPEGWPLRCVDLVFSRADADKTAYGRLYYDKQGSVYGVDFVASSVGTN